MWTLTKHGEFMKTHTIKLYYGSYGAINQDISIPAASIWTIVFLLSDSFRSPDFTRGSIQNCTLILNRLIKNIINRLIYNDDND